MKLIPGLPINNRKGKWNRVSDYIAYGIEDCFRNSDGALIDSLTRLPHFHLFASPIINRLFPFHFQDDSVFLAQLRDALLPHVRPEHENRLFWQLCITFNEPCPVSVREFYDALYSKAVSNESNDEQTLKSIDCDNLEKQDKDAKNMLSLKTAIHIGIPWLSCVMLNNINDPLHKDALDTYSKSKLL